ncbi:phosphodiester glycosidase family protein [Streptomyces sp. NPDC048340]|uniref:phosphodiester glycosidase family protein n=1 Tax=Streptomyces sp. NPDC048340 TaxID=3365537 RepID=UPI0037143362
MQTLRRLPSVLLPALLPVLLTVALAAPADADADGGTEGIETARTTRQVAPGVRLESYDRLEADRWLRVDELVVELGGSATAGTPATPTTPVVAPLAPDPSDGPRADYLGGRGPATVGESAARHPAGPGRRVVAAVNGDFFDIRGTGAPLGPGLSAGRLLHAPAPGAGQAVGFGADGSGRVLRIGLAGSVTLPGGAGGAPLAGYNTARPPADGFAAYTADWPGTELPEAGGGAAVELRDGVVTAVRPAVRRPARRGRPEPGTTLLVAGGTAVPDLAALRPGDAVAVTARAVTEGGPVPVAALGGREALVVAGVPQNHDGEPNNAAAPRTAVGFSRDGRRMRLVTVDGRQRDSGGLTLTGLGRMMHRLGAHDALNLDGGGSSTLLAAVAGATALAVENSPSDGRQRQVPNGLALTVPAGSGLVSGYRIEALGGAARAFPGLTRTLTATGYDAALGPVGQAGPPGSGTTPAWSAEGGAIDSAGVFRAPHRGRAAVHARLGAAHGTLGLDVLGPLRGIRCGPAGIGLAGQGESAGFTVTGYDAQGAAAVVEPRDVTLVHDPSRWRVAPDGRGGFTVTALVPRATGRLHATVRTGGSRAFTAELALGVGLSDHPVAALADAARWTGPGAAPAAGHRGRGLSLDLPAANAANAANGAPTANGAAASATAPQPLPVPEPARSLTLQVHGDGSGARPAVELADGEGAAVTLRGPVVDWSGWREIELPLPAMAERPFTVTRLSAAAGPRPGRLLLDTLRARTPDIATVHAPAAAPDPVVADAARVRARPWRFAVRPARTAGAGAHSGADLVLTGAERRAFVHRGVRFLPLDTARRTLRGGGLERIAALRAALAAAAGEPGTGALALVQRYAPGTVDRKEAALQLHWLAEFRRTTGKRAAVITVGAPRFAAGRTEGVLTVAAPGTGATLVGADAFAAGDWLSVLPPPGA